MQTTDPQPGDRIRVSYETVVSDTGYFLGKGHAQREQAENARVEVIRRYDPILATALDKVAGTITAARCHDAATAGGYEVAKLADETVRTTADVYRAALDATNAELDEQRNTRVHELGEMSRLRDDLGELVGIPYEACKPGNTELVEKLAERLADVKTLLSQRDERDAQLAAAQTTIREHRTRIDNLDAAVRRSRSLRNEALAEIAHLRSLLDERDAKERATLGQQFRAMETAADPADLNRNPSGEYEDPR